MDLNEKYPPTIIYNEAVTDLAAHHFMNGNFGGEQSFVSGVYRIGTRAVMEVAMCFQNFPSFCGGAFGHSPQVRFYPDADARSWAGVSRLLGPGTRACAPQWVNECMDTLDLTSDDWTELTADSDQQEWQQYGYRILANALFTWMARSGRRSVIFSGPDGREIDLFIKEALQVRTMQNSGMDVSGYIVTFGGTDIPIPVRTVVTSTPIRVELQEVDFWMNANSGNQVRWWPLVLHGRTWGDATGDFDGEDVLYEEWDNLSEEEREDWGDFENYCYEVGSTDTTERGRIPAEMEYFRTYHKYIRRFKWQN